MLFNTASSPHSLGRQSVSKVMLTTVLALVPGAIAQVWFFGWGLLANLLIANLVALACEAAILRLRGQPVKPALADGSAVVTACLLALALPPLAPWWLVLVGTVFAIVVAKHLYGGLGFNPFNPAMVGYVVLLISFPREMTQWLPVAELAEARLGLADTFRVVFGGGLPNGVSWDALTGATPLDKVKTDTALALTLSEIRTAPMFGDFGGKGWEWLGNAFLLGGVFLIWRRIITWHIPVGVLGGLFLAAAPFYLLQPDVYPSPLFHVFSGGAMLGAFFIATDPVTAPSSLRGRLLYGAGIGVLIYVIRAWGGYPDGVAFAVLLMNMAAPTIDYFFKPLPLGHEKR